MIAAFLISNRKLSVGNLVLFNQYIAKLFQASSQVMGYIVSLTACDVNANRIKRILNEPIEQDMGSWGCTEIKEVQIDNLSFGYRDRMVLHKLNMNICQFGLYSLVGVNGSGKSTILKILMKLYEYKQGSILLSF